MITKEGFTLHDDEVLYHFQIDRPIHNHQISRFCDEISEIVTERLSKPRSQVRTTTKRWWSLLDGYDHDGYGSYVLKFDTGMWDRSRGELEQFSESISDVIMSTPLIELTLHWISIENDVDDFVESSDDINELVEDYIDSVLDSGYSIKQRSVEDVFSDHMTPELKIAIRDLFLIRALQGRDVECSK